MKGQIFIQEHKLERQHFQHHGQNVGFWFGDFMLSYTPYYRQMYGGVRTENGVAKAAQIFLKKKNISDKTQMPSEVILGDVRGDIPPSRTHSYIPPTKGEQFDHTFGILKNCIIDGFIFFRTHTTKVLSKK